MTCGLLRKWKDFGPDSSCCLSCSQVKPENAEQQTKLQLTNAITHNSIIAAMLSKDTIWHHCFSLNRIKPLDKTTEWQLLRHTWICIKSLFFFQRLAVTQYGVELPGNFCTLIKPDTALAKGSRSQYFTPYYKHIFKTLILLFSQVFLQYAFSLPRQKDICRNVVR